jgi:Rieske Fe-S protein
MAAFPSPSRRQVLVGAGAGAGLAVLAACSSDGAVPGVSPTPTGPVVPPGTELTATSAVPVGGAVGVTVGDAPVLVTQPQEGVFFAFSAVCTHQGCTVNPGEGELLCPCHQSRYDLRTAQVLGGPAPEPLPEISVRVEDGTVVSA